jgi:serine/threonine protein kinase, bacterial
MFVLTENKIDSLFAYYINENTPFLLVDKLGKGGFGATYLLKEKHSGERFVLKRLNKKRLKSAEAITSFQFEKQVISQLENQAFPTYHSEGDMNGIPYFIMELKKGKTFEQWIFQEGKRYSVDESLIIVKKVLQAVLYMHSKGIVHRDLRIPNILFDGRDVSIIDFGLASRLDSSYDHRNIDHPKKAPNHISDLYCLGHFLLFLLYSSYTPTVKKERSWEEELTLPLPLRIFIKKLLLLDTPFMNAKHAYSELEKMMEGRMEYVTIQ